MLCNIGLAKLINNGATFYYRRIISLQLPRSRGEAVQDTDGHLAQIPKGLNKVEQLRVFRVLM